MPPQKPIAIWLDGGEVHIQQDHMQDYGEVEEICIPLTNLETVIDELRRLLAEGIRAARENQTKNDS